MCLYEDAPATVKMKDKFRKLKTNITCYKVYQLTPTKYLKSIFYDSLIKKARWVISDRKSKKRTNFEQSNSIVSKGIHVYTSLVKAKQESYYWSSFEGVEAVIVKVRCYEQDFISAGHSEAVFMKVEITEEAFKKAIGE